MNGYTLIAITLNALTGEPLSWKADAPPQEAEKCIAAAIAKGPQRIQDGKVVVYICAREPSII